MANGACLHDGCERLVRTAGFCNMHYQRKWKHGDSERTLCNGNGKGGISSQGYRVISVNGRRVAEHIHVCEQVIGRLMPKGAEVHHINGIKTDNRPENLIACNNAGYHQLLHARARAMEQSGDPNKRQCVICKRWDSVSNLYIKKSTQSGQHNECRRELRRQRKNVK